MIDTEQTTMVPPVKVGDIVEDQEVINSGKKDDGVIKYEGYIIFVPDCKVGDVITFQIEKTLPHFGIGKKIDGENE